MTASFVSSEIYRATGYRGNHPLAIQRIGTVLSLCEQLGWLSDAEPYIDSPSAGLDELLRFHDQGYVSAMLRAEATGLVPQAVRETYRIGTMENPVFKGLFERASTSVGGSILAAELAAKGGIAYHPSGGTHHGMRDRASGFCFFNDPVFAILTLLDKGKARVLYVDLDAHHGDGVEVAFADDDRVMTLSVHEENRWPYTGTQSSATARNLPVPRAMNDSEFDLLMREAVLPIAKDFAPEAVVITCGADALLGDPLSSLALSNGCLADAVMQLTTLTPSTVVLGGGGYNPWTVARLWTLLWGRISGRTLPETLPETSTALLHSLDCDLVEEDDRNTAWFTTLIDPRNDGPVRDHFRAIAEAARAPRDAVQAA